MAELTQVSIVYLVLSWITCAIYVNGRELPIPNFKGRHNTEFFLSPEPSHKIEIIKGVINEKVVKKEDAWFNRRYGRNYHELTKVLDKKKNLWDYGINREGSKLYGDRQTYNNALQNSGSPPVYISRPGRQRNSKFMATTDRLFSLQKFIYLLKPAADTSISFRPGNRDSKLLMNEERSSRPVLFKEHPHKDEIKLDRFRRQLYPSEDLSGTGGNKIDTTTARTYTQGAHVSPVESASLHASAGTKGDNIAAQNKTDNATQTDQTAPKPAGSVGGPGLATVSSRALFSVSLKTSDVINSTVNNVKVPSIFSSQFNKLEHDTSVTSAKYTEMSSENWLKAEQMTRKAAVGKTSSLSTPSLISRLGTSAHPIVVTAPHSEIDTAPQSKEVASPQPDVTTFSPHAVATFSQPIVATHVRRDIGLMEFSSSVPSSVDRVLFVNEMGNIPLSTIGDLSSVTALHQSAPTLLRTSTERSTAGSVPKNMSSQPTVFSALLSDMTSAMSKFSPKLIISTVPLRMELGISTKPLLTLESATAPENTESTEPAAAPDYIDELISDPATVTEHTEESISEPATTPEHTEETVTDTYLPKSTISTNLNKKTKTELVSTSVKKLKVTFPATAVTRSYPKTILTTILGHTSHSVQVTQTYSKTTLSKVFLTPSKVVPSVQVTGVQVTEVPVSLAHETTDNSSTIVVFSSSVKNEISTTGTSVKVSTLGITSTIEMSEGTTLLQDVKPSASVPEPKVVTTTTLPITSIISASDSPKTSVLAIKGEGTMPHIQASDRNEVSTTASVVISSSTQEIPQPEMVNTEIIPDPEPTLEHNSSSMSYMPAFAEPGPDWVMAKDTWNGAWEFLVYFFGISFLLLAAFTIISTLRLWRMNQLLSRHYFLTLNILVTCVCILRGFYLLLDAHNAEGTFHNVLDYFLYSTAFPCLTSAFSILFYALLHATRIQVMSPKIQKLNVLLAIIGFHFCFSFLTDITVGLNADAKILLFICQLFFVVWGMLLSIVYIYLFKQLYRSAIKRQKALTDLAMTTTTGKFPRYTLGLGVKITLIVAILGLMCITVELYGIFGVYQIFSRERPKPWPWWTYHFCMRLLEFVLCLTMTYVAAQPFKYQQKPGDRVCLLYCAPFRNVMCQLGKDNSDIRLNNMERSFLMKPAVCQYNPPEIKLSANSKIIDHAAEKPDVSFNRKVSMLVMEGGLVRFRREDELYNNVNIFGEKDVNSTSVHNGISATDKSFDEEKQMFGIKNEIITIDSKDDINRKKLDEDNSKSQDTLKPGDDVETSSAGRPDRIPSMNLAASLEWEFDKAFQESFVQDEEIVSVKSYPGMIHSTLESDMLNASFDTDLSDQDGLSDNDQSSNLKLDTSTSSSDSNAFDTNCRRVAKKPLLKKLHRSKSDNPDIVDTKCVDGSKYKSLTTVDGQVVCAPQGLCQPDINSKSIAIDELKRFSFYVNNKIS